MMIKTSTLDNEATLTSSESRNRELFLDVQPSEYRPWHFTNEDLNIEVAKKRIKDGTLEKRHLRHALVFCQISESIYLELMEELNDS